MRKFLAVLLVLLFWLIFPLSFTLLSVKQVLLRADTYKNVLVKEDAYTKILAVLEEQIWQKMSNDENAILKKENISQVVKETITTIWLQQNCEKVIDNIIILITTPTEIKDVDFKVSTKAMKEKFNVALTKQITDQAEPIDMSS